jgi:FAD/FMN-containing dehydrogenase
VASQVGSLSEELRELGSSLRGSVLLPGDDGYREATCSAWCGQFWHRTPVAVARCRGAADVADAVRFAVSKELEIAVRGGGGHHSAGFSTTGSGLVIDLSEMRGVTVDPTARRALVQGGATLGDIDRETEPFGLATPIGVVSKTGIAGLALGGGVGWLQRKHGLTCDNVLGYQVVTADGEIVGASADENPDLFWALRGGGGNFGVVVTFELALHQVDPIVLAGLVFFPPERISEIARWYRDWMPEIPNELTTILVILVAPAAPFIPPELHGRPMAVVMGVYAGSLEEGDRAVSALRALDPVIDTLQPTPFRTFQTFFDVFAPHGLRYNTRSVFLPEVTDEIIEIVVAAHAEASREPEFVSVDAHFHHMGGVIADVAVEGTAWPDRSSPVLLELQAVSADVAGDAAVGLWLDDLECRLRSQGARSGYVNYKGHGSTSQVEEIYGVNYRRLAEVKRKWDPDNVFHRNVNIEPAS